MVRFEAALILALSRTGLYVSSSLNRRSRTMRFEIKLPPVLKDAIDRWRRQQPELTNRAEAARLLIEAGLAATAKPA
jgi:hypothetical protein